MSLALIYGYVVNQIGNEKEHAIMLLLDAAERKWREATRFKFYIFTHQIPKGNSEDRLTLLLESYP